MTNRAGSSEEISFEMDLSVLDTSERKICGVAHVPEVDRQRELIVKEAIQKSLEYFMALPVLHVDHTERPVGLVKKATIRDDGALYVEANVKGTPDCDDIWKRIEKGQSTDPIVKAKGLSKFSIFGRRIKGSPECRVHYSGRNTPCVTTDIYLDSISLCNGDLAVNQPTFVDIVKALSSETELSHTVADGAREDKKNKKKGLSMPANEVVEEEKKEEQPVTEEKIEKSEPEVTSDPVSEKLDKIVELLESTIAKAEPPAEETKVAVVEDVETIRKAFDDKLDVITKAVDELRAENAELKAQIEKMGEETIKKAGEAVIIPPVGKGNSAIVETLKMIEG